MAAPRNMPAGVAAPRMPARWGSRPNSDPMGRSRNATRITSIASNSHPMPLTIRSFQWKRLSGTASSRAVKVAALTPHRLWQIRQAGELDAALGHEQLGVEHRSEEHTSELQSRGHLVCRLLL